MIPLEKITGSHVAGMCDGDRDKLCHLLHEKLRPRLFNSARRILSCDADAEDVCQQTFLKCCEYISACQLTGHLLAWVWAVHMSNALKLLDSRRKAMVSANFDETVSHDPPLLEQKEVISKVWQGVESLPPRQQEVFVLIHQEGLDHTQVAKVLGITNEAVRQNYCRGRQTLQKHLAPWLKDSS